MTLEEIETAYSDLQRRCIQRHTRLTARRLAYAHNPEFAAQVDAEDREEDRRLSREDEARQERNMEAQYRRDVATGVCDEE